jgi:hypothetical protein
MLRRKFLKQTGKGILLTGSPGMLYACTKGKEKTYEERLKEMSLKAFERFDQVWDFNDFWKRGNTFDACLNFVEAMRQKWPDDNDVMSIRKRVSQMLIENLNFFEKFDPGGLWADDFGWWGLMALNARKHLQYLGEIDLAEKYLQLSTNLCWEYKKNTAYDHASEAKPVPHGCRNGDADGAHKGVKNTVTNVLLFLLSSRIYRLCLEENLPDGEKYLDMAYRQWLWFDRWFELEEYAYLKKISDTSALVQERPMAFFEGSDYQEKVHPPWAEGWVWTGDQGMLIAALSDMLGFGGQLEKLVNAQNPDTKFHKKEFEEKIHKYIKLIGKGVQEALIGQNDGIIREAPCQSSFGPVHGNDYLAGRGIMMRYLGSSEEKSLIGVDLSENIRSTVAAIWNTRDRSDNQFQPEFTSPENDKKYIEQFRKLWGIADEVYTWDLKKMKTQNKYGVCQAVGMDMLGAWLKIQS